MNLRDFLKPSSVWTDLKASNKFEIINELAANICAANNNLNQTEVSDILNEREKLGSTGIQDGVAIPHGKVPGITDIIVACGLKKSGIDFESHDGKPSKIFFVLLAPESAAGTHLKILARLSKLLKDEVFRNKMLQSDTPEDLYKTIMDEDRKL